ncbi:MAG: oligosaccharide flippase family protein [Acidobacteriota bacterium]
MIHRPLEETARALLSSAGSASLSQLWRVGVTLATHIALRRMIPPSELGPWYWLEPFFLLLSLFRDLGVPAHVVRDRDRPYGDFLKLQLTWGLAFIAALFVAAPLLARLYHDPAPPMTAMIRALCAFLVVQGLGAVPLIYFEAELKVVRTIPAELVRNLVFAVTALGLAATGHGIWSPVLAHLAGGTVFAAMLWWAAWPDRRRGLMPLTFGKVRFWTLAKIGLPLMVMALLEQAVLKLDPLILALMFSSEVVGAAGLSVFAVFFFSRLLADPIGRALYPALVRYVESPRRAFEAYRSATLLLASLSTPTCFFLFVNAEAAALLLGGREWLGAADYLRVLSLVPLVRPFSMFGLEYLLTRHMDRLLIVYTAANLVSLGGLGLLLSSGPLGPLGMAAAGYLPLGMLALAWGLHRLSPEGLGPMTRQILGLYAAAAVLFLPIAAWVHHPWWRVGLSCLAGLGVLGYAWRRFGDGATRFLRGDV